MGSSDGVVVVGGGGEVVKLLGSWGSSYTQRVQVALKLKGVEYEYVEEELSNKSTTLLVYNPVYKKVPILLHRQNPVAESIVILQYIDETWTHTHPLMPLDPYERALVRFWSHFADDKLGPSVGAVFQSMASIGIGEGSEDVFGAAVEEVRRNLRVVEEEMEKGWLRGRRFLGGDSVGILDLVIGCGSHWIWALEEVAGLSLVDQTTFPRFHSWLRDLEQLPEFTQTIPPADQLLHMLRGQTGTSSSPSPSPSPSPSSTTDEQPRPVDLMN
ncbi:glutathione transferase GST 23-like [Telopea speciosissima]|uniref:glutathione transferase GST 23-like n=1 Tax=Telopea speciosissima TaxID=54955 RepID=UPI001CC37FF3|nr:glutathione transferase GST 23-like [Telopea speciosissima]